MTENTLTEDELAVVDGLLQWVKAWEVVRTAPGRKLLRVITPQDEQQYYTVEGFPERRLFFHEPVSFTVTVYQAKGECRAGHKVGDHWEFAFCTPAGMCGQAYHALFPLLHGLALTSGRYEGPAADETLVTCPDAGWLTFHVQRHRWTPDRWEEEP
jgi:uncharacterized repeat protein (TIGR04076 family)